MVEDSDVNWYVRTGPENNNKTDDGKCGPGLKNETQNERPSERACEMGVEDEKTSTREMQWD